MAKKTPKVPNSTVSKYPRHQARLDNWVGPMQHVADGVSSDPAIRWSPDYRKGVRKYTGEEQQGPPEVEIN